MKCRLIRENDQILRIYLKELNGISRSGTGWLVGKSSIALFDTLSCIKNYRGYFEMATSKYSLYMLINECNKRWYKWLYAWVMHQVGTHIYCRTYIHSFLVSQFYLIPDQYWPSALTTGRSVPGKCKAYDLICVISCSIVDYIFTDFVFIPLNPSKTVSKPLMNHFKTILRPFRIVELGNVRMCIYYANSFWMISRWNWICDGQWN